MKLFPLILLKKYLFITEAIPEKDTSLSYILTYKHT